MSARRLKSTILLAGVAANGLILIAWTQQWFTVALALDQAGGGPVVVGGDVAAAGLSALALAGLALVGALSIAGPAFRLVLGVLQALIGATVTLSSVLAIADPVSASAAAVTEATGVSGESSVASLVQSASTSAWPYLAAVLGVLGVALGVAIVVTVRRWPQSSRKYQAAQFDPESRSAIDPADRGAQAREPDAIADWDALSDGGDPTSR